MNDLKDSGTRQQFVTGAVRDAASNKPLLELLPSWALLAWGWIMEAGARKYSSRNWEKGMPMSRYLSSAMRHIELYRMGFRDEPHLWQALWNVGGAIHTQVLVYLGLYPMEFYDMPNHVKGVSVSNPTGDVIIPIFSDFEKTRVDALIASSKDSVPQRPENERQISRCV